MRERGKTEDGIEWREKSGGVWVARRPDMAFEVAGASRDEAVSNARAYVFRLDDEVVDGVIAPRT